MFVSKYVWYRILGQRKSTISFQGPAAVVNPSNMAEVAGYYYYVVCNASRRSASVMPMFLKNNNIIQLQQRTAKEELTKQKYQAEREKLTK